MSTCCSNAAALMTCFIRQLACMHLTDLRIYIVVEYHILYTCRSFQTIPRLTTMKCFQKRTQQSLADILRHGYQLYK